VPSGFGKPRDDFKLRHRSACLGTPLYFHLPSLRRPMVTFHVQFGKSVVAFLASVSFLSILIFSALSPFRAPSLLSYPNTVAFFLVSVCIRMGVLTPARVGSLNVIVTVAVVSFSSRATSRPDVFGHWGEANSLPFVIDKTTRGSPMIPLPEAVADAFLAPLYPTTAVKVSFLLTPGYPFFILSRHGAIPFCRPSSIFCINRKMMGSS